MPAQGVLLPNLRSGLSVLLAVDPVASALVRCTLVSEGQRTSLE